MTISDSALSNVDINNYNGPLDVLLDLAKAQKVDLEEISITKLADQFHEYITKEKDLNLEIASEYLLMATWLAYLKSKLLLPGTPEEEFKVQNFHDKKVAFSFLTNERELRDMPSNEYLGRYLQACFPPLVLGVTRPDNCYHIVKKEIREANVEKIEKKKIYS